MSVTPRFTVYVEPTKRIKGYAASHGYVRIMMGGIYGITAEGSGATRMGAGDAEAAAEYYRSRGYGVTREEV